MLRPATFLLAILVFASVAQAQPSTTPEPWADPALKVTRGLALWLDASRLNSARASAGLPPLHDGEPIDSWPDASGNRRHLSQADEKARPTLLDGAVRFDGSSSYFQRDEPGLRLRDFTMFIVAAPLSNSGGFRAFAAWYQPDREDYTTGANLDLGVGFSLRFDTFNVEGPGFGGMTNLLNTPSDFGVIRRLSVVSTPGPGGVKLFADGQPALSRDRDAAPLIADRLLVGARFWGHPPFIRSFLDGDILQVLLYDRALSDAERLEVEAYLSSRLGDSPARRPARQGIGKPLVSVPNPPPVQSLVPGFSARELPVDLTNINNLRYRPDGLLVALGYDGTIHLLSDRDGDGLEEHVEPFWDRPGSLVAPIGMALTPPGYARGDGVFVASKGKVSLILDTDRDGHADEEIIVAQGWKQLPHGVDALGVALDPDGRVYFGLGTTDFTNAYQVDPQGRAAYKLDDEHGTIQAIEPDFSSRRIIATGIRFPVGLSFNRAGDLFATDQEGATWLPNGNPFDELLHIQNGRHYGFPPRHPKHLPTVIDEPSTFDYAPQHQSTCGLFFNDPVNGFPPFGPSFWAGDALVTGYSRGKLYRTKLARSPSGYIASNHDLAIMNMLPADACVSPRGDLVVAAHGGLPDWGSGPKGKGKLFKISYIDRDTPQPVLAWASGPREVRVAFDRPVDPSTLAGLSSRASIEHGQAVGPGDRFESLRPGYEVVGRQLAAPRFDLPILSAQVASGGRTLIFTTARHPRATPYALTLPDPVRSRPAGLPQLPDIDLAYDLSGVEATWTPSDASPPWSGWLPHPNLDVSRALTAGSHEHDALWRSLDLPGRLVLKTRVDLWRMLRPAVQPGSSAGYQLPPEEVTLTFSSTRPLTVASPSTPVTNARLTVSPHERSPIPLEISLDTGPGTSFDISWSTSEDPRPRPLPLRRLLLPWAPLDDSTDTLAPREVPELAGGDWAVGRSLFFGDQARCSSCHAVRGQGGDIGPDLSNLIHRDYASVLRDLHDPSAAINPDYISHAVALADGRVLQGTIRTIDDRLIVADTNGLRTTVDRSDVDATSPSSVSIMPAGLDTTLGPDRLRDLLTFLLTEPLSPAPLEIDGAPLPRRRAELEAALAGSLPVDSPRPLRIVLAGGPKDHGPGEHDYPLWVSRWSKLLATDPSVNVSTADGWPSPQQLEDADAIVFYSNNPAWNPDRAAELDRFLSRGRGVVFIHFAVDGHQHVDALASQIGLAWKGGQSAFRHGPLDLNFSSSTHPVARGLGTLRLVDESYWQLTGDPSSVDVLATGVEDGQSRPLVWARQSGPGRVFVSIPGHYTWTFDDPLFRLLLLRGLAWSAGAPVDRFNSLVPLGARLAD